MVQSDESNNLKVGFYGSAPVAQQASASQAAVTITAVTAIATTVFSTAASGVYGFQSSTAATALVTRARQMQVDVEALGVLVNQLRQELVDLNLIKGSS